MHWLDTHGGLLKQNILICIALAEVELISLQSKLR